MRILITGVNGFAGSHLADFFIHQGEAEVYGLARASSSRENLSGVQKKIRLKVCGLNDAEEAKKVLEEIRPDRIYHLAAESFVPDSLNFPKRTITTNIELELNLFEAVRSSGMNVRILVAGSSEEYGEVRSDEIPISEDCALRPLSPYGVSKVAQDLVARVYQKNFGLNVVRTRAFIHTGPRQREVFVASNFARQVALIEAGKQEPVIHVGNLEAVRDFTDVRDMVRAYWLALEKGSMGEVYNICTGTGRSISEILASFLKACPIKVRIEQDPARMRRSDVPVLVGDASRFAAQTGWRPAIHFETTLKDLLNYWRDKVTDHE